MNASRPRHLSEKDRDEILLFSCSLPMRWLDLKMKVAGQVYATDASPDGEEHAAARASAAPGEMPGYIASVMNKMALRALAQRMPLWSNALQAWEDWSRRWIWLVLGRREWWPLTLQQNAAKCISSIADMSFGCKRLNQWRKRRSLNGEGISQKPQKWSLQEDGRASTIQCWAPGDKEQKGPPANCSRICWQSEGGCEAGLRKTTSQLFLEWSWIFSRMAEHEDAICRHSRDPIARQRSAWHTLGRLWRQQGFLKKRGWACLSGVLPSPAAQPCGHSLIRRDLVVNKNGPRWPTVEEHAPHSVGELCKPEHLITKTSLIADLRSQMIGMSVSAMGVARLLVTAHPTCWSNGGGPWHLPSCLKDVWKPKVSWPPSGHPSGQPSRCELPL